MARQKLGHGMDDDICPDLIAAHHCGRGKGVVQHHDQTMLGANLGNACHIGHTQGGV